MKKHKIERPSGLTTKKWLSHEEELFMERQMHTSLRYHIRAKDFLASRKAKQSLVICIGIAVAILTIMVAMMR